jgi:hypothetical protein
MGRPCLVKMSGIQALLSRVENALGASAATRNLMSVFMCLVIPLLYFLFSFRQMDNDCLNTRLVLISPPVETNMLAGGAAYPCKNPEKEEPDRFRSPIEKANKNNYVTKKRTYTFR